MKKKSDPKTVECSECGNRVDYEESVGEKGSYRCNECWRESLIECQVCGEEFEEDQISSFILVKTEFAQTGDRLPGIYRIRHRPFMTSCMIGSDWLHGNDILFVDRLPEPDVKFEISGNICCGCAEKNGYVAIDKNTYGDADDSNVLRKRERRRVQSVLSDHPDMLLDLDTDAVDEDLHRWCPIPVFAPTYRPQVFLEHNGVRIYWTGGKWANWLTLRPEPSQRNCSCFMPRTTFAPSGLKTWEGINLSPDREKDRWGSYYDSGYRYGHEYDYIEAAREACRRAIDLGIITQTQAPADAR